MTDMANHPTQTRTLGEVLPALPSIIVTGSSENSTGGFLATSRSRLSDDQLAAAEAVAAAPLPSLAVADDGVLDRSLRMMTTLPRRKDDEVSGKLRVRAYQLAIGDRPKEALEFLVTEALRTCRFFPSTTECIDILSRWERGDEAVRVRRDASAAVRHERQARFDEMMARLAAGDVEQAEIDALPVSWLEVAETRSHLRREEDGRYTSRVRP